MKPTVKEIEEYMASLNIPEERLNGFSHTDLPFAYYTTPLEEYNVVSKPKHYMLFEEEGIEVRDVIEKLVRKVQGQSLKTVPHYTKEASLFESDYVQLMQYLMRFMDKNGKEDLEKARWYLDKMISAY